jgi:hypothetical protein
MIRRIADWGGMLAWHGRNTDPWRNRMPAQRYLRHSPLSTLRERLWFVSRLEPKVAVTVNIANNRRIRMASAPALTVFLNRWLAVRTVPSPAKPEAPAATPISRNVQPVPLSGPPVMRRSATPAHIALPAMLRRTEPAAGPGPRGPEPEAVVSRLRLRAQRIEDMTPDAPARLVKSAPASPREAIASERDFSGVTPAWRRAARFESGSAPATAQAQAAPVDTEQLTEQVLKQIDRRLIASRERMGRI